MTILHPCLSLFCWLSFSQLEGGLVAKSWRYANLKIFFSCFLFCFCSLCVTKRKDKYWKIYVIHTITIEVLKSLPVNFKMDMGLIFLKSLKFFSFYFKLCWSLILFFVLRALEKFGNNQMKLSQYGRIGCDIGSSFDYALLKRFVYSF